MPDSYCRSRTSAPRITSRSGLKRSLRPSSSAILAALALSLAAAPAWAKKGDAEKGSGLTAPEPDTMGRVHFGPPGAEGIGRVTVQAPASENIQVFLEGRYFGHAPMTIYSVPKGDYIAEGHYADGTQVSRPVSVSATAEATVDPAQGKTER